MRILIYSLGWDLNFFLKFVKPLNALGHEAHFLTNNLDDYQAAKKQGIAIFLLHKGPLESPPTEIEKLLNVWSSTFKQAEAVYSASLYTCRMLHSKYHYHAIFMWNGHSPVCLGLKKFAQETGIKTLFLELANIDGKLFADPQGVNAYSLLYKTPEVLDSYKVDEDAFAQWRVKYLDKNLQTHLVRQAIVRQKGASELARQYLLAFYKKRILGVPNIPNVSLKNYFLKKILNRAQVYQYDDLSSVREPYLFYPLQVSTDTQLILNSDVDNVQAIEIAAKMANDKRLKLVIKPHPAETNKVFIRKIYELKEKTGFCFVTGNTFQLINNANEVLTINSTVGLEARIIGKPVTFLGRSFFSKIDDVQLKKYILGYLIDTDYFNSDLISEACMSKMLNRMNLV